jgi:SAM-dependent methyltransferase
MYRTVRPHLGHTVLDAGAGIGTHTELLLRDGHPVVALEADAAFVQALRERFRGVSSLTVYEADLADPASVARVAPLDSAICLNVLEHIPDDIQAMRSVAGLLKSGGTLIALVPAHPWLYNNFDRAIGHHRRYTRRELVQKLDAAGWKVERVFYFNLFAIAGWFVSGSLLGRTSPGRDLARLYDFLVPPLSFFERVVVRGKYGLSLVAVCRRQ